MRLAFRHCGARIKQLSLGVLATAVIFSGMGPVPANALVAPLSISPFETDQVAPVEASAWSGIESVVDPLTSMSAAGSRASVIGAAAAKVANSMAGTARLAALPAAPQAASDKGAGDVTALPGVSGGDWGVAGQTGAFTWSYPFPIRSAVAGAAPSLSLSYDSSRVDGLTSATNNQASAVGDGWSLAGAGQIRQKFSSCADQGVSGSFDLCGNQGGQSFTASFAGRSGQLVQDAASGTWRLQSDDNTRIEYKTAPGSNGTYDGGYWEVTDPAGTKYFFGLNRLPGWSSGKASTNSVDRVPVGAASSGQPCAAGSFAASLCQQAWAWNLDYVVDPNGNSQAFYYAQDFNFYSSRAGQGARMDYVRTSRLVRVDYGMRAGKELAAPAPLKVDLEYAGRCEGIECAKGNDVPTGFECSVAGNCSTVSPAFYSVKRLAKVVSATRVGGNYQTADIWTLKQSMPDPGDGTKPSLWLGSVEQQGANTNAGAAVSTPPVVFGGQTLQNRVWVVDGQAPLNRYRISQIQQPAGATIVVSYLASDCSPGKLPASPESNTQRCFPQWWAPTAPVAEKARMDYFNVYPVSSVTTNGGSAGDGSQDLVSRFEYLGAPGWKYAAPKVAESTGKSQVTWSVGTGWSKVRTTKGAPSTPTQNGVVETSYLRGLDGSPANGSGALKSVSLTAVDGAVVRDSPWLAGRVVQTQAFLGEGGTLLTSTVTAPWSSAPTATAKESLGKVEARQHGIAAVTTLETQPSGGARVSKTSNVFDNLGRVVAVSATGDPVSGSQGTCTATVFADNRSANILNLPASSTTRAGQCGPNGRSDGTLLAASQVLYDGSSSAVPGSAGYQAPQKGNPTRTDKAKSADGGQVLWQKGSARTFDALGRPISETDTSTGSSRTISLTYTPTEGPVTEASARNPLGWTTVESFDPVRGKLLKSVDANGAVTSYSYDAAGQETGMWDPSRPQDKNRTPTLGKAYRLSQTEPSWTRTDQINGKGETVSSFAVFDGLGRLRQTQRPSPTGGTIASDVLYNGSGDQRLVRNAYYLSSNPDGVLRIPAVAVPSSTEFEYDGVGRPTRIRALANDNQEQWVTRFGYQGLNVETIFGPGGEAARRLTKDVSGNVVKRELFRGPDASGTADVTSYIFDPLQRMTAMTDPAGNGWSWSYDLLGNQLSSKDPDSGISTNSYDDAGRLATVKVSNGTTGSYRYDVLDRVVEYQIAEAEKAATTLVSKVYDSEKKGLQSSSTRFNGVNFDQPVTTRQSGFTVLNQPTKSSLEVPGSAVQLGGKYETTASYTRTGKIARVDLPKIGALPTEELYYSYDSLDNPSSLDNQDWDMYAGNTQYNQLGWLAGYEQTDDQLYTTSPTNGLNRVSFVWDATTSRLTKTTASNTTRSRQISLGETSYGYAPSGRLTSRTTLAPAGGGADTAPGGTDRQCYNYDYAGRLSGVWTPGSAECSAGFDPKALGGPAAYAQQFSYTLSGARSQVKRFSGTGEVVSTEDYQYLAAGSAGTNQVQKIVATAANGSKTEQVFGWDASGRMVDRAGQKLNYTADGLLLNSVGQSQVPANPNFGLKPGGSAASGSAGDERWYTAGGDLVLIKDGTGTTLTLDSATVYADKSGKTSGTRTYQFAGKNVAQRVTVPGATGANATIKQFMVSDSVNTGQVLTGPSSGSSGISVRSRYTDPMGLQRGSAQSAASVSNGSNPDGFGAANGYIGGLADAGTGLTHLGARDLDSVTGIFTAPDPILDVSNANQFMPYAYAENDPINKSDPSGLFAFVLIPFIPVIIAGIKAALITTAVVGAGVVAYEGINRWKQSYRFPSSSGAGTGAAAAASVTAAAGAVLNFGSVSVSSSSAASIGYRGPSSYRGSSSGYRAPSGYRGPTGYRGPASAGGSGTIANQAAALAAAAAEAARIAAMIEANRVAAAQSLAAVNGQRLNNESANAGAAASGAAAGGLNLPMPDPDDEDPVNNLLNRLRDGKTSPNREVDNEAQIQEAWRWITSRPGQLSSETTKNGQSYLSFAGEGWRATLRAWSGSGRSTIQIFINGIKNFRPKIHIK